MATTTKTDRTGVLEHIDPNTIVIEANVRPSEPVTKEFVASIKEHGVLTPVFARRDEHGNILVRAGQRRTLGAREAGVATIPVYVVEGDENTATRIIEQLVENEHRKDLNDADRAAAWQQLAFEGLSAATIAKRTGTKAATVKQGLAVVENPTAVTAVVEHQLDLEQAATLIEFDDDPEVTAELIAVAKDDPSDFPHAVQRARDDRAQAQKKADAEAAVAAAGYTILTERPAHDDDTVLAVNRLRNAEGNRVAAESLANVAGASALVRILWNGEVDVEYFLAGWKEHGYTNAWANTASNSGPMTDEQKAERKALIANNKAWASAETVRREWLAAFITRKTLPKDAIQFIAHGLSTHRGDVQAAMQGGNAYAQKLLGIEPGSGWRADKIGEYVTANPTKAQHASLAVVLGGIEDHTDRNAWRNPSAQKAAYLAQLATWGYTLRGGAAGDRRSRRRSRQARRPLRQRRQ